MIKGALGMDTVVGVIVGWEGRYKESQDEDGGAYIIR